MTHRKAENSRFYYARYKEGKDIYLSFQWYDSMWTLFPFFPCCLFSVSCQTDKILAKLIEKDFRNEIPVQGIREIPTDANRDSETSSLQRDSPTPDGRKKSFQIFLLLNF